MGQDNCHPRPGDLIAIYRKGYQHWALYVGDGYVIHVTSVHSRSTWGSSSSMSARAKVKKQLLEEVVGNNKWRVNNKYDRFFPPLPVKMIIQFAECFVDSEVTYGVLANNCEHFVTMLRYGVSVSDQVTKAVAAITGITSALLSVVAPVVAPAVAVGSFLAGAAVKPALALVNILVRPVVMREIRSYTG